MEFSPIVERFDNEMRKALEFEKNNSLLSHGISELVELNNEMITKKGRGIEFIC
jgi:hypothetical protein